MKRIVLSTRNRDKIREIQRIMAELPVELVSISNFANTSEVDEDGDTLEANALKKARYACQVTGLPALADDTGLEVDALDGAPGVYSSRYAGEDVTYEDNNNKLMKDMQDIPAEKRSARFRCVVAYVDGNEEKVLDGTCEGEILTACSGDKGFGYDPLFFIPQKGKTFAEMDDLEKNEISHRGEAFMRMTEYLKKKFRMYD